ncbi:MAG TPA: PucR family transcriptional regulator ligand-binding domain-containing protein [Clostridia bacterium]|nr:PucR family transcriptional regulator ligand-binding domain-containing protein [Clostridia bacterium]
MDEQVFTLRDVLDLPDFPEQRLLTRTLNAEAVQIRHIGVNEAPAGDFVRTGEMVLTTAVGCREPDTFAAYLEELREGGAAAVAVTFEDADCDAVPETALCRAEQLGLPVVWLPWKYRFADIVETVLDRIRSAEKHAALHWENFQRSLLETYLQKGNIARAAALIARELGARTALLDAAGGVLAEAENHGVPAETGAPRNWERDYHLLVRVGSQNRDLGAILVSRADMTAERLAGVQAYSSYIVLPLLLWFDRDELALHARARRMQDIVLAFAKGRFDNSEEALSMARFIGLRPEQPHICLMGRLRFEDKDAAGWLGEHGGALNALLPGLWPGGMIALRADALLAFTPRLAAAQSMAVELAHRLAQEFPGLGCVWGTSAPGTAGCFGQLCENALLAASLALIEGKPYLCERDTELCRLIREGAAGKDARDIAARRLAALDAYEAAHGAGLREILLSYFANGQNASRTARALHFHRQSLLYKLVRAEEILGFSLEDHDETLALELSLRAREYERMDKT